MIVESTHLSLIWGIPFVGILLSIALCPIWAPQFWHRYYGKVVLFWSGVFLLPHLLAHDFQSTLLLTKHVLLEDYVPFVVLIGALFITTGGIRLDTNWTGSPGHNTLVLGIGSLLASWIGTTGAAMLLVRPLIRANAWRQRNVHVKIFFIFLVANIGGVLTPLGDPPLFIGYLQGVPFFWTTATLFVPLIFIMTTLLILFYIIDRLFHRKEEAQAPYTANSFWEMRIEGTINIPLLLGIMASVIFVKSQILREGLMIALAALSWFLTPQSTREANSFSWEPLKEVAKLFFGIFLTIAPVITMLKEGLEGPFAVLLQEVGTGNTASPALYFSLSALLSAFLDNAPTYYVLFHMAGGDAGLLTTSWAPTLIALSCGAVFGGAMTYIGNAPNFMVKSIAEQHGVKMPSFFGYLLWSVVILIPVFTAFVWGFL